jgi:hypothetical protein
MTVHVSPYEFDHVHSYDNAGDCSTYAEASNRRTQAFGLRLRGRGTRVARCGRPR